MELQCQVQGAARECSDRPPAAPVRVEIRKSQEEFKAIFEGVWPLDHELFFLRGFFLEFLELGVFEASKLLGVG